MIAVTFFFTIINCHDQLFSHEEFLLFASFFPHLLSSIQAMWASTVTALPSGVVPSQDSHLWPPVPSPALRSDLFSMFPHSEWEALSGGDFHRLCYRPLPPDSLLSQGFCCSQLKSLECSTSWLCYKQG